jgi:Ca2+-binding RTX toxin-like protein
MRLFNSIIGRKSNKIVETPARREAKAPVGLESLEDRRMMSVSYNATTGTVAITGTAGNDYITAYSNSSTGKTTFYGASASPTSIITGGILKVEVYASGGNDTVRLTSMVAKPTYISLGDGNDVFYGGAGNDIVVAGNGDDIVLAGAGNDNVYGGFGNDAIDGQAGNDYLYGGDGNDIITGGTGKDYMYGQNGNDTIYAKDRVSEVVDGGLGYDVAHVDNDAHTWWPFDTEVRDSKYSIELAL